MKQKKTATIRTERKQAVRQLAEHRGAVQDIREAAGAAVTSDVIRRAIWDSGVDVDRLVDLFATNHLVKDFRDIELQKQSLDGLADTLMRRLETMWSADARCNLRELLDGWYSRYLLAADVGFELGWGAAHALQGVRR